MLSYKMRNRPLFFLVRYAYYLYVNVLGDVVAFVHLIYCFAHEQLTPERFVSPVDYLFRVDFEVHQCFFVDFPYQ